MGDRWGQPTLYEKHLKATLKRHDTEESNKDAANGVININAVMLNAELHVLHRALQGFQLGALSAAVTAVHTRLDRLTKN
jgi:hypothetical protein